jgi:hypothetical protein
LILIDYAGFIFAWPVQNGIRVFYYISPKCGLDVGPGVEYRAAVDALFRNFFLRDEFLRVRLPVRTRG